MIQDAFYTGGKDDLKFLFSNEWLLPCFQSCVAYAICGGFLAFFIFYFFAFWWDV